LWHRKDGPAGKLTFAFRIQADDFRAAFMAAEAKLSQPTVRLDGDPIDAQFDMMAKNCTLRFAEKLTLTAGQKLQVKFVK